MLSISVSVNKLLISLWALGEELGDVAVSAPTVDSVSVGTQVSGDIPVTVANLSEVSTAFFTITTSSQGGTSASNVVAGTVADQVDSGNFVATEGGGPYAVGLASDLDGSYYLQIVFRDAEDNLSTVYEDGPFVLDTTAPSILATSVTAGDGQLLVDWSTDTAEGSARVIAVADGQVVPTGPQILAGTDGSDVAAASASPVTVVSASGAQAQVTLSGLTNGVTYDVYITHRDGQLNYDIALIADQVPVSPVSVGYVEDFQTDPYQGTYAGEALFPTSVGGVAITITQETAAAVPGALPGASTGRLFFEAAASGYARIEIPVDGSTDFTSLVVRWGNSSGNSNASRDGRMIWLDASKVAIGAAFNTVSLGNQTFSEAIYNGDQVGSLTTMPATARYLAIDVNVSAPLDAFLYDLEFDF